MAGTLTRTALFGADDMPNVRAIQHGYAIQPLSEYAGLRPPPPVPDAGLPGVGRAAGAVLGLRRLSELPARVRRAAPERGRAVRATRRDRSRRRARLAPGRTCRPTCSPQSRPARSRGSPTSRRRRRTRPPRSDSSAHASSSATTTSPAPSPPRWGSTARSPKKRSTAAAAWTPTANSSSGDRTLHAALRQGARCRRRSSSGRSRCIGCPSRLLAANPIDRYSIGDRTPGIAYAEDGSLDDRAPARPSQPIPARRANWLPTPAGEPFTVIYRLYGPGEQAQAGTWSLPPISPGVG